MQCDVSTITGKGSSRTDFGSNNVHHELYGGKVVGEGVAVFYEFEQCYTSRPYIRTDGVFMTGYTLRLGKTLSLKSRTGKRE